MFRVLSKECHVYTKAQTNKHLYNDYINRSVPKSKKKKKIKILSWPSNCRVRNLPFEFCRRRISGEHGGVWATNLTLEKLF